MKNSSSTTGSSANQNASAGNNHNSSSHLSRVYPEPSSVKKILKKTPYAKSMSHSASVYNSSNAPNNTNVTASSASSSSSTINRGTSSPLPYLQQKKSKRAIGDASVMVSSSSPTPSAKRQKHILKPLSAESIKFNGRVSTDRVLLKMLLSNQIHTMLHLEKFHNLLDQEKFFQALCVALNQLEGRISRLYIGVNSGKGSGSSGGSNNGSSTGRSSRSRMRSNNGSRLNNGSSSTSPSHSASAVSQLQALLAEQGAPPELLQQAQNSLTKQAKYSLKEKSCYYLAESLLYLKEFWIRSVRMEPEGLSCFATFLEKVREIISSEEQEDSMPSARSGSHSSRSMSSRQPKQSGSMTQRKKRSKLQNFQLTCLGFTGMTLTDEHMPHVSQMIQSNIPTLKRLILNRTRISEEGLCTILEALPDNNSLELLSLSENAFSATAISQLASFIQTQTQTSCCIKKWSLAQINMQEDQAQEIIEALRTNDVVVELSLHNNPGIKQRTLMAITALLDINNDISKLDTDSSEAHHLREEKSQVIDYYLEQMDEQTKALYFLRSQKPPDFLELYALRLMRDLAHLEQQISDMHHLVESHAVELHREPKVERSLDIMHRVSQRLNKALRSLCPRVKDDGFESHVERYKHEIIMALTRDESLQEDTEQSLEVLKEEMDRLQEQIFDDRMTPFPDEDDDQEDNTSQQVTQEQEPQQQASGEAIYDSGDENNTAAPNKDVEGRVNPTTTEQPTKRRNINEPSPELVLVAHRAKIAKLREVQTRITKRWKEVDIDDLDVENDLKERVVDMKLQCNAADSLGVFKNLERRFLTDRDEQTDSAHHAMMEEEWKDKEFKYKQQIVQLQTRIAELELQQEEL